MSEEADEPFTGDEIQQIVDFIHIDLSSISPTAPPPQADQARLYIFTSVCSLASWEFLHLQACSYFQHTIVDLPEEG
ncbi:hypothetical protein L1987_22156 [Smallanthus sonchifolius]|uniref:Uncharacterized protein n=1 Tax=Smallanthus sonchifolius TaxID=185202 RepID=A0ACB9IDW2_9ASTR|nr:hypothetical protein L1987_22156 [Smallanthus sonchifolius]